MADYDYEKYPISGRSGFMKEPERLKADIPDRVLLDSATKDRETLIVMYELPGNTQPYVTWMARRDAPENTFYGHYFSTIEEAQEDFEKRLGHSWGFR